MADSLRLNTQSEQMQYVAKLFSQESESLNKARSFARQHQCEHMMISAVEAQMLKVLIQMTEVHTLVEVGTLMGYSALAFAEAMPDDGKVFTFEKQQTNAACAQQVFDSSPVGHKIQLHLGDAQQTLTKFTPPQPVDAVFIDADKQSYPIYLDWAEQNLKKGGLILGDNAFLFGQVHKEQPDSEITPAAWQAMREFNSRLADRLKYSSTLLPTSEGLLVAIKNF